MGEYNPELGKQKHADMQAMNFAKLKMEYHRFCMITWENCVKYACDIVALQEPNEDEEEIEKEIFDMAEKVFEFIEQKADAMFDQRYHRLEHDAKANKPNNEKEIEDQYVFFNPGKRE